MIGPPGGLIILMLVVAVMAIFCILMAYIYVASLGYRWCRVNLIMFDVTSWLIPMVKTP